jgi:hypothetical protein
MERLGNLLRSFTSRYFGCGLLGETGPIFFKNFTMEVLHLKNYHL